MSPEFTAWCAVHLPPLTHSSDLTLPHYLMTLDSPSQVREYIHEYLGTGEAVDAFCEGFLRMKEFEQGEERVGAPHSSKQSQPADADKNGPTSDADKKSRRRRRRKNEEF